jgi:hypothetical protein
MSDKPTRVQGQIPNDYPDDFLDCRVDRHSWERPRIMDPWMRVPYGWPVYRECSKCGAFWARAYNRDLTRKVFERRYYAPGYVLRNVGGMSGRPRTIQYLRLLIQRENTVYIDPDDTSSSPI